MPPRSPLPIVTGDREPPRGGGHGALAEALASRTREATLVERIDARRLRCTACAHRCVVEDERAGACGVRFGRDGSLRVPYGYVARRYARAVETNTMYHVRPGARSLTFGMFGCDLRCPYCHNHRVSQAIRDGAEGELPIDVTPEALVAEAIADGCEVLCAAYNEPMIAAEWVRAVFDEAKRRGLATAIVSDGHTTHEALEHVRPVTDVFRVDLKGYRREHYKDLGGRIEPVLESIARAKQLGLWVEVVTLVVPGWNDDAAGLRDVADWIATIDPTIPWHVDAFVPRYRLTSLPRTPILTLVSAAGTGYARGLSYVYVGNVSDLTDELAHTRCPSCRTIVVERHDWQTRAVHLVDGACPSCATKIPGLWGRAGVTVSGAGGATRAPEP